MGELSLPYSMNISSSYSAIYTTPIARRLPCVGTSYFVELATHRETANVDADQIIGLLVYAAFNLEKHFIIWFNIILLKKHGPAASHRYLTSSHSHRPICLCLSRWIFEDEWSTRAGIQGVGRNICLLRITIWWHPSRDCPATRTMKCIVIFCADSLIWAVR